MALAIKEYFFLSSSVNFIILDNLFDIIFIVFLLKSNKNNYLFL